MLAATVHFERNGAAFSDAQCGFKALGSALPQGRRRILLCGLGSRANFDAINDHIDVVLLGLLELGQFLRFDHLAVDAKAHKTRRLHLRKQF